ncbi:MAG: putative sugar nucleotidyl transferase [Spirochaetota bacterium]
MNICLFEDHACEDLLPLVHLRPVWELRCGVDTLLEKLLRVYPDARVTLFCREHLRAAAEERSGLPVPSSALTGEQLFINARVPVTGPLPALDRGPDRSGRAGEGRLREGPGKSPVTGRMCLQGESVLYARLSGGREAGLTPDLFLSGDLPRRLRSLGAQEVQAGPERAGPVQAAIRYPWDLIEDLDTRIRDDILCRGGTGDLRGRWEGALLLEPSGVRLGEGSRLMPGCTVNAETGPVYIGERVMVYPGAYLQGPCAVGSGCVIRPGARISGSSLGPVCKVGGEVEESVLQGYANKQHDGFLGHSYVGSWCNLGAGTSGSNLKNTYGTVRVPLHGVPTDTGTLFAGLFMGDHVKTGINTSFNTGTLVGVMAGITGPGFPPTFIPSFVWGGARGFEPYDLNRALETAGRMMARRNRVLTPVERSLIEHVYRLTAPERELQGIL